MIIKKGKIRCIIFTVHHHESFNKNYFQIVILRKFKKGIGKHLVQERKNCSPKSKSSRKEEISVDWMLCNLWVIFNQKIFYFFLKVFFPLAMANFECFRLVFFCLRRNQNENNVKRAFKVKSSTQMIIFSKIIWFL